MRCVCVCVHISPSQVIHAIGSVGGNLMDISLRELIRVILCSAGEPLP